MAFPSYFSHSVQLLSYIRKGIYKKKYAHAKTSNETLIKKRDSKNKKRKNYKGKKKEFVEDPTPWISNRTEIATLVQGRQKGSRLASR